MTTPIGKLLREERVRARRSLRETADHLGVSHTYLGQVERGKRRTLPREYWEALNSIIPALTRERLEDATIRTERQVFDIADSEEPVQDFVLELARRINTLPDHKARRMLEILRGNDQ